MSSSILQQIWSKTKFQFQSLHQKLKDNIVQQSNDEQSQERIVSSFSQEKKRFQVSHSANLKNLDENAQNHYQNISQEDIKNYKQPNRRYQLPNAQKVDINQDQKKIQEKLLEAEQLKKNLENQLLVVNQFISQQKSLLEMQKYQITPKNKNNISPNNNKIEVKKLKAYQNSVQARIRIQQDPEAIKKSQELLKHLRELKQEREKRLKKRQHDWENDDFFQEEIKKVQQDYENRHKAQQAIFEYQQKQSIQDRIDLQNKKKLELEEQQQRNRQFVKNLYKSESYNRVQNPTEKEILVREQEIQQLILKMKEQQKETSQLNISGFSKQKFKVDKNNLIKINPPQQPYIYYMKNQSPSNSNEQNLIEKSND